MGKKLTTKEFIEKAKSVHGDRYDYSKVEYKNIYSKVCIICSIHGEFMQTPNDHLNGRGCKQCGIESRKIKQRLSTEEFIEKAKKIHGDRYDYSKVEYINNSTKVEIIDTLDGSTFYMNPSHHLKGCGNPSERYKKISNKLSFNNDIFIAKAKSVHGDKYDYTKVEYANNHTKVCIICPKHGEFMQTPDKHIQGRGCRKCQYEYLHTLQSNSTEEFIKKAKKIHGDKYDYSKVEYINNHTNVIINCPIHGEFMQLPVVHYKGCGCQKCGNSILEEEVRKFLEDNHINYEYEKKFDWLKYSKRQSIDFFLPDFNIGIECQGEQHYRPVKFFGGEYKYQITVLRDENKKELCHKHGIQLVYFIHINNNEFECDTYFDMNSLSNIIKKC